MDFPELMRPWWRWMGRKWRWFFLRNNLEWSATSIVDLYRCRWQIEVFFKQIKQTLFHALTGSFVEEVGCAGTAAALWDSRTAAVEWTTRLHATRKTDSELLTHCLGEDIQFQGNPLIFVQISQHVGWL